MIHWIKQNKESIIRIAFLIPILSVAIISISHVVSWYNLANPLSWAIYLSVAIEVAALSSIAAASVKVKGFSVWFVFIIVTLIQFIGNIFFAYQYIDINSVAFKDWVELVDPLVSFIGVGDISGHKRFLALFAGGMLPLISLSFLHMLVKFEEEDKKKQSELPKVEQIDIDALSIEAGKQEALIENEKYNPTEEDLKRLEEELVKLNEQKFGTLEEPTTSEEQINEPDKKVLNYLRRDA